MQGQCFCYMSWCRDSDFVTWPGAGGGQGLTRLFFLMVLTGARAGTVILLHGTVFLLHSLALGQ